MVKQLKRNSNWFTRKQSENAPSVMDFSSTTVKKYIFKGILAQNRTRTIVFIVIGVYQRQKNLGSRVALLPGKFLRV